VSIKLFGYLAGLALIALAVYMARRRPRGRMRLVAGPPVRK
jgi:hypothetical protein